MIINPNAADLLHVQDIIEVLHAEDMERRGEKIRQLQREIDRPPGRVGDEESA